MKIIPLVFFLFIVPACFGQGSDYLILHSGDTIRGKIILKGNRFLLTPASGNTVTYEAVRVNKVQAQDIRNSIVVPCKLHAYTDDIMELERYQYSGLDRDTLMILDEIYSTPKMNLYWGTDDFKRQYYFYKTPADSLPVQLYINYTLAGGLTATENKGLMTDDARTHVEVQKGFVNQLRLIMGDCKKISEGEWEILDYRSYSLKSVIKKYNRCK